MPVYTVVIINVRGRHLLLSPRHPTSSERSGHCATPSHRIVPGIHSPHSAHLNPLPMANGGRGAKGGRAGDRQFNSSEPSRHWKTPSQMMLLSCLMHTLSEHRWNLQRRAGIAFKPLKSLTAVYRKKPT